MDEASDGVRLGVAVKAIREARGESQASLARRAGVHPSWISRLEQSEIDRPYAVTVDSVAQALNFRDANDLLRWVFGHDGYARRRPRGYRRVARQRPEGDVQNGGGGRSGKCSPAAAG
jgi:transcriptional regulator with XRE-family HTH domain